MNDTSGSRAAGRAPTLRDVAKRANVSPMTVSNVINERTSRVREETRKKVLAAIEDIGYRPHRGGRSLKTNREYAIRFHIVHPDRKFLDDPYITEVAAGMSNALARENYSLVVSGVRDFAELRQSTMHSSDVDGVAVMTSGARTERERIYGMLAEFNHPLVVIQDELPDDVSDGCAILQDDAAGAREVTERVIDSGAETLLFVATRRKWPAVERRWAGTRQAARGRARLSRLSCEESDFSQMIETIGAHLDMNGAPDGIIGANDQIAIAAMNAAHRRSLHVPDDIAVTGFNAFAFREYVHPLIMSVVSPAYAIGEQTAQTHLWRIANDRFRDRRLLFSTHLAPGESVRSN